MPERSQGRSHKPALRLYPQPSQDVGETGIYGDLELPRPPSPFRPYVIINMVASVDGRASVSGKASGIGGEADRRAMRALRSGVDAVMVGAGTLRVERLNLGLEDPDAIQPLAVILCGSGPLPLRERLVESPQDTLLVIPEDSSDFPEEIIDRAKILRVGASGPGRVDLLALLDILRSRYGVERLLVEGGPAVNRALIDEELADELFLTIAPKLLSGHESSILVGGAATHGARDLTLLSVHASGDELFLRYRLEHHP